MDDELPELAADWAMLLGDIDDAELDAAVVAYLRSASPYWPTAGQLLPLVPSRQLAAVDDAAEAWALTKRWVRANGYREPDVGDLDAEDLVRDGAMRAGLRALGGAKGFGQGAADQETWTAKRFEGEYRTARKRSGVEHEGAMLTDLSRLIGIDGPRGGMRQIGGGR